MRTRRPGRDDGFTLVELLVAVMLLGLLMAIAVPSFQGLQNGVRQSATQSDLASNRTAIVEYSIDNNGVFPASTGFDPRSGATDLTGYGWSQSAETTAYRYLLNAQSSAWCLEMTNSTGVVYRVSTNTGTVQGLCSGLSAY